MTELTFSQRVHSRLAQYKPTLLHRTGRQAAVLVVLIEQPEPAVLLTVRSLQLKSHPGDVSFPGGMVENDDVDVVATALREAQEEVGITLSPHQVVGRLSTALSKDGLPVHSILAMVPELATLTLCHEEISEAFVVPWRFFQHTTPEFTPIKRHGIEFEVPHYYFQGRHIWGLTAMILLELINVLEGADWPLPQHLLTDHNHLVDR